MSAGRRPAAVLWTVEGFDGLRSAPLSKPELDERAKAGQLDGRALVKRQDWFEARTAAELYQGLATPCPPANSAAAQTPFGSDLPVAPPWAALPEPPLPPPVARRRPNRRRFAVIALLIAGALGGFLTFASALGSPVIKPLYSRHTLFWLFALYWFGMLLAAAGLFGWQPRALLKEPETPPLPPLSPNARWAIGIAGLALMAAVLWVIW